jgi:DNA-binding response OmpR family regulator
MRVAVLEDDPVEAEVIGQWLMAAGFLCAIYERVNSLLCALGRESVNVAVLDCTHFDAEQVDILKRVRSTRRSPVPVLLISTCTSDVDIVTALAQGADDYIAKPLRHPELLARIRVLSNRSGDSPQSTAIEVGSLRLDRYARAASRNGQFVHLSAKDFDLAVALLLNIGSVISYEQMRQAAWCSGESPSRRTIHTHVCSIRRTLGLTPPNGLQLVAVYGRGYRLDRCAKLPIDKTLELAAALQQVAAPAPATVSALQRWPR